MGCHILRIKLTSIWRLSVCYMSLGGQFELKIKLAFKLDSVERD
jgi:hypothetical protein